MEQIIHEGVTLVSMPGKQSLGAAISKESLTYATLAYSEPMPFISLRENEYVVEMNNFAPDVIYKKLSAYISEIAHYCFDDVQSFIILKVLSSTDAGIVTRYISDSGCIDHARFLTFQGMLAFVAKTIHTNQNEDLFAQTDKLIRQLPGEAREFAEQVSYQLLLELGCRNLRRSIVLEFGEFLVPFNHALAPRPAPVLRKEPTEVPDLRLKILDYDRQRAIFRNSVHGGSFTATIRDQQLYEKLHVVGESRTAAKGTFLDAVDAQNRVKLELVDLQLQDQEE